MKVFKLSGTILTFCVLAGIFISLQIAFTHSTRTIQLPQYCIDLCSLILVLLLYSVIHARIVDALNHLLNREAIWVTTQLRHLAEEVKFITHLLRLRRVIVRRISEIFNLQAVSLFTLDSSGEIHELSDCFGLNMKDNRKYQFKASGGFMVWMTMTKKPLYLARLTQSEKYQYLGREEKEKLKKLQAALCLPLVYEDRLTGVLLLSSKPKNKVYFEEEIQLLFEVATKTAQAIENATTHRNLNSLQRSLTSSQNRIKGLETRYEELRKVHQTLMDYIKMGILVLKSGKNIINLNDEFKKGLALDIERRYQDTLLAKAEKVKKP
ncbi:GAF domain-containing protein [candidate division KSB1 bacterium]|nr:GAF domain-containing protein [candidate division KSB1 bacterium]